MAILAGYPIGHTAEEMVKGIKERLNELAKAQNGWALIFQHKDETRKPEEIQLALEKEGLEKQVFVEPYILDSLVIRASQ